MWPIRFGGQALESEVEWTPVNSSVLVEAIAGAAAVIVAALSYVFTKMKEREADWRKWKFEQYKDFVASLSGTVVGDSTPDGQRAFTRACNTLNLIGSAGVLAALRAFRYETGPSNPHKSLAKHDELLSRLIWEIREDVGIPETPEVSEFSAHSWSSGTAEKSELRNPTDER